MKRIFAVLLIACMIALPMTACGEKHEEPTGSMSLAGDMGVRVGGSWFVLRTEASGLIEALGSQYELEEMPSSLYAGTDKVYRYEECRVLTNPDGEQDIWYCIQISGQACSTARNIKVGNTREEVVSKYGDNYYEDEEKRMVYSSSGIPGDLLSPYLAFSFDNGVVSGIEVCSPPQI